MFDVKLLLRSFSCAFILGLLPQVAAAASPDVPEPYQDCRGPLVVPMPPDTVNICEIVAGLGSTSQQDSSLVYLRLAISQQLNGSISGQDLADSDAARAEFFAKAIAADPKNQDAYFYQAQSLVGDEAISTLNHGLEQIPHAPHLLAAIALKDYERRKAPGVNALCDEALSSASEDRLVMRMCAWAYKAVDETDKALAVYAKLKDGHSVFVRDVAGLDVGENPAFEMGQIYLAKGQPEKAAAVMEEYVKRVPGNTVFPQEYLGLARFHMAARQYPEAVTAYENALKDPGSFKPEETQVKLLVALALAGKGEEAHRLADQLKGRLDKHTVLELQVALRNSGARNLPITGQWDDLTQARIDSCITNKSCIQ